MADMCRSLVCVFLLVGACKSSGFRSQVERTEDAGSPVTTSTIKTTTTTTTASPMPVENPVNTTIESKTTELQINQSCDQPAQLLSSKVKISYPKRQKCSYNVKPNLEPKEKFVQASEVSPATLLLPENSEICTMTLESAPDAKLQYDDFLVLTIDDFVIFASNIVLTSKLLKVGNFYKWDFARVVGSEINDFADPPYCVGSAQNCKFPGTDMVGPVMLNLQNSEISGITKTLQGKSSVPMNLVATGDNDPTDADPSKFDCYHEALDLTVSLNYIKKPK